MEIITQTNRTILFDEINPEKLDLLTLVGDVHAMDSLDDDKIKEINDKLLVSNFSEFLQKFAPTVYSFFNAVDQSIIFTLKKPEHIPDELISEIQIGETNDFLAMLLSMVETKTSMGIPNVDFRFEKILELISPKKVVDDIKQTRKEIHYLYGEYDKIDEGDPLKLDIADRLNVKFEEASQNYNNVLGMLPLAIEDIKTRLLFGQEDPYHAKPFELGILTMGDEGELKVIEAPKDDGKQLVAIEEGTNNALVTAFEEDYENITDRPTDYVKNLVVRAFCPLPAINSPTAIDVKKEVQNYNDYLTFYRDSKNAFIKVVKPLMEKILGVKTFFDQYQTKVKEMPPRLLVTNARLEMTVKSQYLPRTKAFLNSVNNKNNFDNTIWYAIVNNIDFETEDNKRIRRERFKGNIKVVNKDANTMESLAVILNTLKDYRVQTFFSFDTNDETTFMKLATHGIDRYMDKCKVLMRQEYSEFSIPCLPNISVVPKNKSGVVVDSLMEYTENGAQLSEDKKDLLKFWINGIYISGSYVAAGLMAAYQCPAFLRKHFKTATLEFPGVRFDVEADDNALVVPSTLAKEISGYTATIKDIINHRSFGFILSSDNNQLNGRDVNRIKIYKARSLSMQDNTFEAVYRTQVASYVARYLRAATNDYKHDSVVKFFSSHPNSQKSKWEKMREYINPILGEDDELEYSIDSKYNLCHINIIFGGNVKNLEIEISKSDVDAEPIIAG